AHDWRAIVAEQARNRTVALGPSLSAQDDFHKADVALRLCAQNARDRIDLTYEGRLVLDELDIAMREEIFIAAAWIGLARLLIILRIENDLDRTSHWRLPLRPSWLRGQAGG